MNLNIPSQQTPGTCICKHSFPHSWRIGYLCFCYCISVNNWYFAKSDALTKKENPLDARRMGKL